MELLIPAIIIGFVGGCLDRFTDCPKVWCFLIGVGVFFFYVFTEALITTIKIKRNK